MLKVAYQSDSMSSKENDPSASSAQIKSNLESSKDELSTNNKQESLHKDANKIECKVGDLKKNTISMYKDAFQSDDMTSIKDDPPVQSDSKIKSNKDQSSTSNTKEPIPKDKIIKKSNVVVDQPDSLEMVEDIGIDGHENKNNGSGSGKEEKKVDGDEDKEEEEKNCCYRCLLACWNYEWCDSEHATDDYPPPPVIQTEREKELRKDLPEFTWDAMELTCPRCEEQVTTMTQTTSGILTVMVSFAICITGIGCLGPCFVPYYTPRLLNMEHFCPKCKAYLGAFQRM